MAFVSDDIRFANFTRELVQAEVTDLFVSYFNLLMTLRAAPSSLTPQRILVALLASPAAAERLEGVIRADQQRLSLQSRIRVLEAEVALEKTALQIRGDQRVAAQFAAKKRINQLNYKEHF